jgi:aerobic carbon-monoxide dehydrogenase medium subunit
MKPPRFEYFDPRSLDEALSLLRARAADAKLLAGGQSLMPLLNFRLARPGALIDLNRLPALDYIREDDGVVRIGALCRQRQVERSPVVAARCPLLQAATRWVGHAAIRTRGTVGGSIAHADPAAEYPAVLAALDGQVVVRSAARERVLGAREFFVTYLTTALEPDEMVTEVRFPALPPDAAWSFLEFARRHGDFAIAGVACVVVGANAGPCRDARLALCGVGGAPVRARRAEDLLRGAPITDRAIEQAAAAVGDAIDPPSDLHADADYRRHLAVVLTRRALRAAVARAAGGP